jgi:Mrp family chromosome partitioning ATPase
LSEDFAAPSEPEGRIIPLATDTPEVPWARSEAAERGIFGFDSRDLRSRPFNLLRRRILRQVEARGWKLFGIVSPAPQTGKSFVASNLAAALSRTPNLDVYLFDLDLRKSSIAGLFGIEETPGLNHYLTGEQPTLQSVVRRLEGEQLFIVPTVSSSLPSGELLADTPMERLTEAMRQLPDNAICICDLPPVFANDDAAIIASKLDTYILVLEEGRTTKKQLKDSMHLLAPAVCGGTVLNRYSGGLFSDDYGYSYSQNASYGGYFRNS